MNFLKVVKFVLFFSLVVLFCTQGRLYAADRTVSASDIEDPNGLKAQSLRWWIESTGGLCKEVGNHTINLDWAKYRVDYGVINSDNFPIHYIVSKALVIPADCQATSITINGSQPSNGNFGNTESVFDGKNVNTGCTFEINATTTKVTFKNLTFVNGKSGASVCIKTDTPVTLDNVNVGVRTINDARAPSATGSAVGVSVEGKNASVLTSRISKNTVGVSISDKGQSLLQYNDFSTNIVGVNIAGNNSSLLTNNIHENFAGVVIEGNASGNKIGNGVPNGINIITGNTNGGIILNGSEVSKSNVISNNSIFQNTGLGIDLGSDKLPTLFADQLVTPNNSIHFPEGVIITPATVAGTFEYSANSHATAGSRFVVEIYEVDPQDVTDPAQKRDGRSYGEGKRLVASNEVVVDASGKFVTQFSGSVSKTYSATLTHVPASGVFSSDGTSEFSAVVKTDGDPTNKNPICEGEGGNQNGDGIKAPNAPSDVVLTRTGSDIVVTFKDNSDNEDGFRVERAAGNCQAAVNYTQVAGSPLPANAGNVVTITDKNVGSGNVCYRVTAFRIIPDSDKHDLKECPSIVTRQGLSNNPGDGTTDQPPVIVVNPKPTQPKDPVVIIITDHSINEDNFCVERADGTCERPTSDFKPIGKIPSQNKTGTGGTVVYKDPTAEAGHLYCYRAKPEINGNCVDSLVSNKDDAVKLNLDGSTVVPGELVAEGSGGCSISNSVSKFNLFNLIALLAIAPVALARAFRFKKV